MLAPPFLISYVNESLVPYKSAFFRQPSPAELQELHKEKSRVVIADTLNQALWRQEQKNYVTQIRVLRLAVRHGRGAECRVILSLFSVKWHS